MPDLEKDMQKKEKDSRSKDEPVSDCFGENEKEKKKTKIGYFKQLTVRLMLYIITTVKQTLF